MIVHHSAAKTLTVVIVAFCDLSNFYLFIFLVGGWGEGGHITMKQTLS